ncbi:hypothetical protein AB3U99_01200 [Niallia sp. JL1B1071]|uniref:hypothetical protein n=1 Tax=Niallia tiangongensis TaxID=3237105 RepID=UPI0037DC1193
MTISREFHPYRSAFIQEKTLAKKELSKSEKDFKWKKRKYDASAIFGDINTHDEFERVSEEKNVFSMVFTNLKDIKEEALFPCEIFDGNEAWIGKDAIGKYKYFTGEPFNEAVAYSIFDLLLCFQGVQGKGYTQQRKFVRDELINLLNVFNGDADWEQKEREKYIENIHILTLFKNQEFQAKYPNLFKKIKSYLYVLEDMLIHGQKFINIEKRNEKNNSIFSMYASQSKVSPASFSNVVKRFKELGFLFAEEKRVTFFDKRIQSECLTNTTFYSFPLYSETFFKEIEESLKHNKGHK